MFFKLFRNIFYFFFVCFHYYVHCCCSSCNDKNFSTEDKRLKKNEDSAIRYREHFGTNNGQNEILRCYKKNGINFYFITGDVTKVYGDRSVMQLSERDTFFKSAVLNAANDSYSGGGGVDGCVHKMSDGEDPDGKNYCCNDLSSLCKEAKKKIGNKNDIVVTNNMELYEKQSKKNAKKTRIMSKLIYHAVGPSCGITNNPTEVEKNKLKLVYTNCLKQAIKDEVGSISFVSISTGIFGYPFSSEICKCNKKYAAVNVISEVFSEFCFNLVEGIKLDIVFVFFKGSEENKSREALFRAVEEKEIFRNTRCSEEEGKIYEFKVVAT